MQLEEARRILAEQDTADPKRALEAVAAILRFHGIADPALLPIAEQIEDVAEGVVDTEGGPAR